MVRGEQRLRALRRRAEALDSLDDVRQLRHLARVHHQAAEDVKRALRVLEPNLVGLGDADQRVDSLRARQRPRLTLLEVDERRPVLLGLVQRLEDVDDPVTHVLVLEQPLEPLTRLLVQRLDQQDLVEQLDRVGEAHQLVADDLSRPLEQRGALGVVVDHGREPPQTLLDVGPALEARVEIDHRLDRGLRLAVADRDVDDPLIGLDRGVQVLGLVALDLADLAPQPGLLEVVLDDLDALTEHVAELLPVLQLNEQPLERVEGDRVLGVVVEDLVVGRRRALRILQAFLQQARDLEAGADLALGLLDEAQLPAQRLDQRGVVLGVAMEPDQRARGFLDEREIGRIEIDELRVGLARAVDVAQEVVEDRRHPREQIDLEVVVLGALDRGLPDLDERALLLEVKPEALDLRARIRALRIHYVCLAQGLESALGVVEIDLLDLRDLEQVADGLVALPHRLGARAADLQHADHRLVIVELHVDRLEHRRYLKLDVVVLEQLLEQRARGLVPLVLLDHRAQQLDGSEHVLELVLSQRRAPTPDLALQRLVLDQVEPAPVQLLEREVVVLVVALLVHRGEQLDGREVVRLEVEQLLRRADRDGLVVERVTGELDDPLQQPALLVGLEDRVRPAAVEVDELLVRAASPVELLERLVGLLVRLVLVEDRGVDPLGVVGLVEVVAVQAAELDPQVASQRAVGLFDVATGVLGLVDPLGDVIDRAVKRGRYHRQLIEITRLLAQAGPAGRVERLGDEEREPDAQRLDLAPGHALVDVEQLGELQAADARIRLVIGDDLHRLGLFHPVFDAAVVRQQPADDPQRDARVGAAQQLERVDRREVIGLELEDLQEAVDRLRGLVQALRVDLRDLEEQRDLGLGGVHEAEPLLEHADELAPLFGLAQDPRLALERAGVRRREQQELLEGLDRGVVVLELLFLQRGDAAQHRHAPVDALGCLEAHAEDRYELLPHLEVGVEILERGDRGLVARLELEDLLEVALGCLRVAPSVARDGRELVEQLEALVGVDVVAGEALLEQPDQLAPAVAALGRALETRPQHDIVGAQLVGAAGPGQRDLGLLLLVQRDVADRRDVLEALVVVLGRPEQDLVGGDQLVPVLLLTVDGQDLVSGQRIAGLELEHLLERREAAGRRAELVAAEARHAPVERDLLVDVVDRAAVRGALEDVHDLRDPALLFEQVHKVIPTTSRDVGVAQRRARARVVGVEAHDLLPHPRRVLLAVQAVGVDAAEVDEHLDRRGRVDRVLDPPVHHLGDLGPAIRRLVEGRERREGLVDVAVVLEHVVPAGDVQLDVVEALLGQPRDLHPDLERGLSWRIGQLLTQQLDQRLPVAAELVDPRHHRASLAVAGHDLERLVELRQPLVRVVELVEVDAGDPPQHVGLTLAVPLALRRVDEALVDVEQIVPAPVLAVGLGQRGQARVVPRVDVEDALQGLERHRVEVELIAVDLGDLEQALDSLLPTIGLVRDALELILEQLDERGPLLPEPVEPAQRGGGVVVVPVLAQHAAPHLDRTPDAPELVLGEVGHLLRQLEPKLGVVLRSPPRLDEHLHQLRSLFLTRVDRAIKREQVRARGLGPSHAPKVGLGELGVPAGLPDRQTGEQGDRVPLRVSWRALGRDLGGVDDVFRRRLVDDQSTENRRRSVE